MEKGTLIIFSGLPGSGKSTMAAKLASAIQAVYIRIDTVEQGLRDICEISQIDGKGYRLSYRIAQENLQLGNNVIADSVNPEDFTRKEWNGVAEEIGATYLNVEVFCSDEGEHKFRVENRVSSVPGLQLPTWSDVSSSTYHDWKEDRIKLDTSGKSPEQSFEELLAKVNDRIEPR